MEASQSSSEFVSTSTVSDTPEEAAAIHSGSARSLMAVLRAMVLSVHAHVSGSGTLEPPYRLDRDGDILSRGRRGDPLELGDLFGDRRDVHVLGGGS